MQLFITKLVGKACARSPEFLLRWFAGTLGLALFLLFPRKRVMMTSLAASFPDRSEDWRRKIGRTCCIRLVETGLLSLAMPHFTEKQVRRIGAMSQNTRSFFADHAKNPHPVVLGTVHLAYWEGLTWVPFFLAPEKAPEILTIYRPMRDPSMDTWLRETRERFGVKLMSRKSGLHAALHLLHRDAVVALLFDQSAGSHGLLTRFLGRECSTTPLPGMLVERSGAETALIFARRRGFWRFEIDLIRVENDRTEKGVTISLNRAFENLLTTDDNLCASWLWLHQRWRILDRPEERAKLEAKRGGLIE